MAAAGVQTAQTPLGLSSDSAWTYPGLKGRGFFLGKDFGLSEDSTWTDWTLLGLSHCEPEKFTFKEVI